MATAGQLKRGRAWATSKQAPTIAIPIPVAWRTQRGISLWGSIAASCRQSALPSGDATMPPSSQLTAKLPPASTAPPTAMRTDIPSERRSCRPIQIPASSGGNNLVAIGWASRRVTTRALLRNWSIVFVGNFVGALATAALMFATEQHTLGGGAVGDQALAIAEAKLGYSFGQAVALGAFCNALVCLAVWLTFSARTTTDKILAVIPPIAAFVAAGFEHSVANMYFIPIALLIKTDGDFAAGGAADLSDLTWGSFFADNLVPVTIGNIIGGSLMVAAVYWVIYLRKSTSET